MLRRKTGSFMRSGAEANRNSGRSCQCSCSRVPRMSGVSAAWRRITSAAPSSKRSAEPITAVGQPVSACTSCSHRTSSRERSSGQLAWT